MNYPYAPRMDGRVELTGVYNSGSGTTAFTLPYPNSNIGAVVLGNSFGSAAGTVLTPVGDVAGGVIYVDGQFVAGPCILGELIDMEIELSQPFRRDQEDRAIISDRLQVETVVADHRNAGDYNIEARMDNRADRVRSFEPEDVLDENGQLRTFLNGDTRTTSWFITATGPKPVTVSSIEFVADVSPRTRQ